MAEGLIKFTYREGAKTPPVISEWLRAKPEGMSYPEYLNVVLIECLTDEDSAERVAQNVAAGSAPVAAGTGGVTASEVRSIVSDDGALTREAIRDLSAGASGEAGDANVGLSLNALSMEDAESLAQSLIEAVEHDGAVTRKAMETLSQTLSDIRDVREDAGTTESDETETATRSDADLERIVTRLKDSILTDGQKTREMLDQVLEALSAAHGSENAEVVTAAEADGALREVLRSDMLDMVSTIRQDSHVMRDDISRVVTELAGNQSVSFDERTTKFLGNLHRSIAKLLAKVDTIQDQMSQVHKVVSESHDTMWEDARKQEQLIRESYDEVIAALDKIGGQTSSAGSADETLLPDGISFSVPDDLFSPIGSATGTDLPETPSMPGINFDLPPNVDNAPAEDAPAEDNGNPDIDVAGLAGMLATDDDSIPEQGPEDFNPFGDVFSGEPDSRTDSSSKLDDHAETSGNLENSTASMPWPVSVDEFEPVPGNEHATDDEQSDDELAGDGAGASMSVDEIPRVPLTDPRNDFLGANAPVVSHGATTPWSDDAEAPYGGLQASNPESADEAKQEQRQRALGDMLRSLLG